MGAFRDFFTGLIDRLTGNVKKVLIEDTIKDEKDNQSWLKRMIIHVNEWLEKETGDIIDDFDSEKQVGEEPNAIYERFISYFKRPKKVIWLVPALMFLVGYSMSIVMAAFTGLGEKIKQWSYSKWKPYILNPQEILQAEWRSIGKEESIITNWDKLGFDNNYKELYQQLYRFVPNVSDIIRFMVRDVFNDAIVEKYHYDDGWDAIKEEAGGHAEKIGMDADWLQQYWRAHWELPSPRMGYEMLHRGAIEMDDLKTLLKIADYAPYFIDPMIEIAYSPYTRVDVRRMYSQGVLEKNEVFRAYKDIGYKEDKAEKLTDWTVSMDMKREKDLTKAELMKSYINGDTTRLSAEEGLKNLGYSIEEVDIIISLTEYKEEKRLRDYEIRVLKKEYKNNVITYEKLKKSLEEIGLSEKYINLSLREAILMKREEVTEG